METDFPQSGPLPAWVVLTNMQSELTPSGFGRQCCCLQDRSHRDAVLGRLPKRTAWFRLFNLSPET